MPAITKPKSRYDRADEAHRLCVEITNPDRSLPIVTLTTRRRGSGTALSPTILGERIGEEAQIAHHDEHWIKP